MNIRPWQRQPGETPADFTAFAAYLRLKGRRSHRAAAAQTGRSPAALRRLSARFNWSGRVAAFELRLADATQDALDSVLDRQPAAAQTDLEQLRIKEFLLADRVIHESRHWLKLAADPRRRNISLNQICRLTELAFKLKCLAVGVPWIDQPRRRRKEDLPGYWTGPSAKEALEKIYGSKSTAQPAAPDSGSAGSPLPVGSAGRAGSPLPAASIPANTPALSAVKPLAEGGRPQGPPKPAWPPPDDKRDLTPHRLVIGPHGLWCLQRMDLKPYD